MRLVLSLGHGLPEKLLKQAEYAVNGGDRRHLTQWWAKGLK